MKASSFSTKKQKTFLLSLAISTNTSASKNKPRIDSGISSYNNVHFKSNQEHILPPEVADFLCQLRQFN